MITGELLREARKRAGLTQKQVADKLHVRPQIICLWERGNRYPKIQSLDKLADAIGCSIAELVDPTYVGQIDSIGHWKRIAMKHQRAWRDKTVSQFEQGLTAEARHSLAVLKGIEELSDSLGLIDADLMESSALLTMIDKKEIEMTKILKGLR